MAMIKKLSIYLVILLGSIFFLVNSSAMSWKRGEIRIFDFKYEQFEFFNGNVVVELPDKPRSSSSDGKYSKVLMDFALSWTAGRYEISKTKLDSFKGPIFSEFAGKLVLKRETKIESSYTSISRRAIWYGENPLVFILHTMWDEGIFPTPAARDARIAADDAIFEHIVESFRYRSEDGSYAKPEIVRQPEEVKTQEPSGVRYDGTSAQKRVS